MEVEIKQLVVHRTDIFAGYGVVVNNNGNRRVVQIMPEKNILTNDEFFKEIDKIIQKQISWRPVYFRKNLDKMYFVGSDGTKWYEAINSYGAYAPTVYHAIIWKGNVLPTDQKAITKIRKNKSNNANFIPMEPLELTKEINGDFGFPDYLNKIGTNKFHCIAVDALDKFAEVSLLWKQSNYEGFSKKSKQILKMLRRDYAGT